MKHGILKFTITLTMLVITAGHVFAQQKATLKINNKTSYQKIRGFGGFVNSPQFAYNHMSPAEIAKIWGSASETGYNIMRIFISDNENSWPQAIATAQQAKSLGLILFASPWSMPAQWKTNNSTAGVNENGVIGYLKEEHYADYANFLNRFVVLLRNNGVELDAISIQNEPDYDVTYSGCHWTPAQMAKFLKEQAYRISCKVMSPETVGLSNVLYADALSANDVVGSFDIYAGHQYGGVGNAHKIFRQKGKEVWQSEFLINWNSNTNIPARDFNWFLDAFDFAKAINTSMLADVSAWVHYASKRYYGMLGDGIYGTVNGEITKRGYILSHYAKYVTGATRIENTWNDDSGLLDGSSYISEDGNQSIAVIINNSANNYVLTVDLPFYTLGGSQVTTTAASNMSQQAISLTAETARPKVEIAASSITTLIFNKSSERPESQMAGNRVYYDRLDDKIATNTAFGTSYKLSGKTVTFKHDSPLISANTSLANGYLALGQQFNRLVLHVDQLSSTLNYTSSNTTLHYINRSGVLRTHNYGTVDLNKRVNFDWVFDISTNVLPEGCLGIVGITNGNYSSVFTIKFGDVYLATGTEKMHQFTGIYSAADGDLLDCLEDITYTSIDFSQTTGITGSMDWQSSAANKNGLFYVAGGINNQQNNVVSGANAAHIRLNDESGNFYAPNNFTAAVASLQTTLSGFKMMVLPFESNIPAGVKAYILQPSATAVNGTLITGSKIPANTPFLAKGTGTFNFEGTGMVSTPRNLKVNGASGVYIQVKAPLNSYYLKYEAGQVSFQKVSAASTLEIKPFGAYIDAATALTASELPLILNDGGHLPVEWANFNLKQEGLFARLNWTVFSESNNTGFHIERSGDGLLFENIGFVSGAGTSNSVKTYSFTDYSPLSGNAYYRLRQVDADGQSSYSEIRVLHFSAGLSITLYPNPADHQLHIISTKEEGIMEILDTNGRVVAKAFIPKNTGAVVDVGSLKTGIYVYRLGSKSGTFIKR